MAFTKDDTTELTALKAELQNDPQAIGYNVEWVGEIVQKINAKNYTQRKPADELTIQDVAAAINPTDYAALTEYDKEFVKQFINREQNTSLKPFRAKMLELFGGTATITAIQAARQVPASRAEVLFGYGVTITENDIALARRYG